MQSTHIWEKDIIQVWGDNRDYCCKICNIKAFLNVSCNKYFIYNVNGIEVDDLTCNEYIIKTIIE